ncbi:ParA family protein [Palleronia caenipelagi]|uniref:ParA family protein n=1 Tax=Palleronia caenipelagi TaxID=2489174 RepID=A0A547PM59_9RHOB|nr:ParA family protein [Palleronia caenipelagi]TRD15230.1 ParA family protein [Palleronia caenipelagi]
MIVSILSPKGGCGKSTTALTLATVFARNPELSVAIVDGDPRQSLARVWLSKRELSQLDAPPFHVISDPSDATILDTLDAAREKYDLTFVDLEGVAGLMASYAAAASDACIVPMRPSALDGDAAGAALKMIRDAGRTSRRNIPVRILITQTDAAIMTTSYREIIEELDGAGVPRFQTELMRRAAFERMMAEGKTLFELNTSKAVAGAISNAAVLGQEIADVLEAE